MSIISFVLNKDEILKEVEEEVSEKYFSGSGVDEYLITYTIKNLKIGGSNRFVRAFSHEL